MLFEIDHLTRYDYSTPVQLAEHLLRLVPTERPGLTLGDCRVTVTPLPIGRESDVDRWGNRMERLWFEGETDSLQIGAHLEVRTSDAQAPLAAFALGMDYGAERAMLTPYLEPPADTGPLQAFLQPLLAAADHDGAAFLHALNRAIHRFHPHDVRLDGPPRSPRQTLALGEGVCRDLTVLFMAACRQLGIAARFVSGYQQANGVRLKRHLHAWPEVYLPGRGWVGFDPTHDALVGGDHVPVAAAPSPAAVTPVEGGYTFQGARLTSTLATDIRITTKSTD